MRDRKVKGATLKTSSGDFLDYLEQWYRDLPEVSFSSLLKEYSPEETAIVCVDVVNGFCKEGNLASPRIGQIIDPVVQLFRKAEQHGLNHYVLPQDTHPPDSKEFLIYPEHCVEGSEESQMVSELNELPNSYKFRVIPKRTINPGLERDFQEWVREHEKIRQFILVGDCTDICVYQIGMFLKIYSVEKDTLMNVIVPADCVNTYEISIDDYKKKGIAPHPGDLTHLFFLHHLQLNGIQVVEGIR
jgi:nicotinamidase-related amidase